MKAEKGDGLIEKRFRIPGEKDDGFRTLIGFLNGLTERRGPLKFISEESSQGGKNRIRTYGLESTRLVVQNETPGYALAIKDHGETSIGNALKYVQNGISPQLEAVQ